MEYPLCDQVVTVYRRQEGSIARQVIEGCYYSWQERQVTDEDGSRRETTCLLVVPGDTRRVFIGDRVFDGIGPEITVDQWQGFLPVSVPGLAEVSYVQSCYRDGRLCHTEAGKK